MTIHDPRPPKFAETVPLLALSDLPAAEAGLIVLLRQWDDGADGRAAVQRQVVGALGPTAGARALASLDPFLDLLFDFARRALMRRLPGCHCASSDEVAVAKLVAAAARGEREEALMIGFALVRVDCAPALVRAAEQLGLALGRATAPAPVRPVGATLH